MTDCNTNTRPAQGGSEGDGSGSVPPAERPERFDWVRRLIRAGEVVELCALGVMTNESDDPVNLYGYFDSDRLDEFVRQAALLSGCGTGVYWTLNPVRPAVQARADYAIHECRRRTRDQDIDRRRRLVIDVDPVRPGGLSASAGERDQAWAVAAAVAAHLRERGWPAPVVADSGNGYHLLYAIDLPAADGGVVKGALAALAARFNRPEARIDTQVYNPSRMIRLYGTANCKGEPTDERPHRESAVLEIPETIEVVTKDQLGAVAADGPPVEPAGGPEPGGRPRERADVTPAVDRRVRAYIAKVPPAVSGQGGHNHTYRLACTLVLGFGLSPDQAYPYLAAWNETLGERWTEKELWHKLHDADQEPGERGDMLRSSVGDAPAEPPDALVVGSGHPDDPHRLADALLSRYYRAGSALALRYHCETFHEWRDNRYAALRDSEFEATVNVRLRDLLRGSDGKNRSVRVTNALVSNVIGALKGLCLLPADTGTPAWLGAAAADPGRDVIPVRNGLLGLGEAAKVRELRPGSPELFSPVCLPMGYDPGAACPTWLRFLDRNLECDADRIALLQEWFGYCLTYDTSFAKFLVMEGEGANGKSVACAALTALLGERNVSHVRLEDFDGEFTVQHMVGKLANVVAEVGEIDKTAEGRLKGLTAGDRTTLNRKNKPLVDVEPTARLVFATNSAPRFRDRSDGLRRRLILLPFRVQIPEGDRVRGMDKDTWWAQTGELPGMLNWALQGFERLRAQGRFTESQVCREAARDFWRDCNTAEAFLDECCRPVRGQRYAKATLFAQYQDYCKANNRQPLSNTEFGKVVGRVYPQPKNPQKAPGPGKKRVNAYEGFTYDGPADFSTLIW